MPVMALQFSMFLAFMVYVDGSRREELRSRGDTAQEKPGQPIPPVTVGTP
jgi:hypothetical protein